MYVTILIHHGIKGQKWGIRRYQNPDGSLTPEGQRRFYKTLTETQKTGNSSSDYRHTKDSEDAVIDAYKNTISEHDRIALANAKKNFKDAVSKLPEDDDFMYSKERYEADNKAHKATLDYFKKNHRTELNSMLEKTGGDDTDLIGFHDFRKTYEGYQDIYWAEYEKKYDARMNTPENRKLRANFESAYKDYQTQVETISKTMLGPYYSIPIQQYRSSTKRPSGEVVSAILSNLPPEILKPER